MVKIGIIGADTPQAGELIRILINHPEVDLITLFAPSLSGRSVSSYHHGLLGENIPNFSDKIDPSTLDLLYVADNSSVAESIIQQKENWPDLRIIDLSPGRFMAENRDSFEYGLSEMNRKGMVRGAVYSILPSSMASVALIALTPPAKFLLLNSPLELEVNLSDLLWNEIGSLDVIEKEIAEKIQDLQSSFGGTVKIERKISKNKSRVMEIRILIDCSLPIEEISKIYEGIYDDHNFTFISFSPVSAGEVEGTQKTVITLNKPVSDKLEIRVIGDGVMRGGAGDAVHAMNLLFGLHEKTGLHLKASKYGIEKGSSEQSSSWFA